MNVQLKALRVFVNDEETGEVKTFTNYRLYFSDEHFITIKPVFDNDYKTLKGLVHSGVVEMIIDTKPRG